MSSSWRACLLIAPFLGIGRCLSACSASPPASWFLTIRYLRPILPATLVIYLGVLGIIIGILAIIGGFTGGGIGNFIFGVLNLLIGILLLSSPIAATLAVPFVFGILLLIEGLALIIWAFRVRA